MTCKLQRLRQVGPNLHVRLDFLVVRFDVRAQLGVTLQCRLVDAHRQRLDVSERLQPDGLRFLGNAYMLRHLGGKRRTRHVALHVSEPVGTFPVAPLRQRLAQVTDALGYGIVLPVHQFETLDGQFAGLGQVAIDGYQRIQPLQALSIVFPLSTFHYIYCRQTGCLPVARLRIVFVQPLPGIQLAANHAQQVVIIIGLAVLAGDDEGLIRVCLHLSQHLGVFHCLLAISLSLAGGILAQPTAIVLVHLRQYGIVDGLQRHVLGVSAFHFFLQPLHGRQQRVGSHFGLQLRRQQRRLQQLTVVAGFLSLRLYLLQVFHSGLGQVFVLSLIHLFPQFLICLTEYSHGHEQHRCHQD